MNQTISFMSTQRVAESGKFVSQSDNHFVLFCNLSFWKNATDHTYCNVVSTVR